MLRLIFAFLILASTAFAADLPLCASFTQSDAAFVGKILKIENAQKSEELPAGTKKVRFQVTRNFKGAENGTFAVFSDGSLPLKNGQTWIVFVANDIVVKSFAIARAIQVDAKSTPAEIDELAAIATGNSYGSVAGRIVATMSSDELRSVVVTLNGGGKTVTSKPDDSGFFRFPTPDGGRFRVELRFPFQASVAWPDTLLGANLTKGAPTLFGYDVRINPGDCSYVSLDVAR